MEAKRLLRASVLRHRAARTQGERDAAGALLAIAGLELARGCRVVAAYASVGTEPPTRPLLEALNAAVRVVVPVVSGADLGWGDLVSWSELVPSPTGLLEPARMSEDASDAAAAADLILVPALAVDRQGNRLGRGGGYYDRWLPGRAGGLVVAVVYDDEVLEAVPHEPHDSRVDAALTPRGLVPVGQ